MSEKKVLNNILVITPIYPGNGALKSHTPVVHYFTREWVKMGYHVYVVHLTTTFPSIFYKVPKRVKDFLQQRSGFAIPTHGLNKAETFDNEGVSVLRIPIKKFIPHGKIRESILKDISNETCTYLSNKDFIPDFIIGHWEVPCASIIYYLKKHYPQSTTAIILHGVRKHQFDVYRKDVWNSIDIWGYRSAFIQREHERLYGKNRYEFLCPSGINGNYLYEMRNRSWKNIRNYVFVGMLIERKHPDCIIEALNAAYNDKNFHLKIIGEGPMRRKLSSQMKNYCLENSISLCGRISRDDVIKKIDESEVFIMISNNETFGLVYLEAMARGCIVVASRNEGMDGIIVDGNNGFLCEAGNAMELTSIIVKIKNMSPEDLTRMSLNARETAEKLTDVKVAESYINTIANYSNNIREGK